MKLARQIIAESEARCPVVMFSGAKDSLLTLLLVREVYPDAPVIWYRMGSAAQRKAVEYWTMKYGLTVYSYQPSDVYYLPMAEHAVLVKEFMINGMAFPVIVETIPGSGCGLRLQPSPLPFAYDWDVTFTGWKDTDTHELTGGKVHYAPNETVIGGSRFIAPIRHMTDEEVLSSLKDLAPEFEDFDDSLPICTKCFTSNEAEVFCPEDQAMIPTFQYDKTASLNAFQERFQLGG